MDMAAISFSLAIIQDRDDEGEAPVAAAISGDAIESDAEALLAQYAHARGVEVKAPVPIEDCRAIDTGLHLGYRKGLNGGRWVCRRYLGAGNYEVATVAIADDHSPADGASILDFFQAQRKAREVAALAKAPAKTAFTVAAAMDAYFERLEHEGSRSLADARRGARFHILPALGDILVADLTRDTISKWLTGMAGKGADGHSGQDAIRGQPGQRQPGSHHTPRGAESSL